MITLIRRPRMGAWIEIRFSLNTFKALLVAPAWGRGLKLEVLFDGLPHGGRPRMGAWIEIRLCLRQAHIPWSPPHGGVD